MWEWLAKLGAGLIRGIPRWLLFALAVVSSVFLFAPESVRETLWMPKVNSWSGALAGLFFLFSVAPFAYFLFEPAVLEARKRIGVSYDTRRLLGQTPYLARDEWAVLKRYMVEEKRTLRWPLDYGPVKSLQAHGYLHRASSASTSWAFPFTVQPWIWKALKDGRVVVPDDVDPDPEGH